MNNGLTDVFVSVLSLAASELARNDRQREFAVWLACRDQTVGGCGCVSFDVSELPWNVDMFPTDRAFVLGTVEAAKRKTGWSRLDYQPKEDWVFQALERFHALIEAFDVRHIRGDADSSWRGLRPSAFVLCTEHSVYHHAAGCVVCNE